MLENYLKIAWRALLKNKIYSTINILGLAIGIACCLLILLYVENEFSYDQFHEKADDIYRIALERVYPDRTSNYAVIPSGIAKVAKEDIPEVKEAVRTFGGNFDMTFDYKEDRFKESNVFFADSNLLRVFTIPLLKGNPETALQKPYSVIMTQKTAQKYFKGEDAMGRHITINDTIVYTVTGVCEAFPSNSHFEFDMLISMSSVQQQFIQNPDYISFTVFTYLLLNEGANPKTVEERFPELVEKYAAGQIKNRLGVTFKEYQEAGNGYYYSLQALKDIHLYSKLEGEPKPPGNITYVRVFIIIAIFILLLACINFMNMATSQSMDRAREVGVRKVVGSDRRQLIFQFLTESILVSLIGMVLALVLIQLTLPVFNDLTGKEIQINYFSSSLLIPKIILFTLFTGLLAGSYPAFMLSSFNPVLVLKGKFRNSRKGIWLRNGLVIFQFTISIVLISCTLIVFQQMNFLQKMDLGFNKDQIIVVENAFLLNDKIKTFKQEAKQYPDIIQVGASNTDLSNGFFFGVMFQPKGKDSEVVTIRGMTVDENYLETMQLELLEGRDFSQKYQDSLSVIINETAVKDLGLKNPIGKTIYNPGNTPEEMIAYKIVGVVKDFNFQSLHEEIAPLAIFSLTGPNNFNNVLMIKIRPENVSESITNLEKVWKKFNPKDEFTYHFLDRQMEEMYQAEKASGNVFAAFATLAIVIACIGLLGLIAYTTQNRKKEIGVRKILGAKVFNILFILSKDFVILIVVANIIAIPIAWYAMDNWLQNFATKISMNPLFFLLAGFITLLIAVLTVSFQTLKAANVNPVNTLRNE